MRVRLGFTRDGLDSAVDGTYRILFEQYDVHHLHGQSQVGFLRQQGGIDELDVVGGLHHRP